MNLKKLQLQKENIIINERVNNIYDVLDEGSYIKELIVEGKVLYDEISDNHHVDICYSAEIESKCDRCLANIKFYVKNSVKFLLDIKNNIDEEISIFIENNVLNLEDIIIEDIILNKPFQNICKEDCKGICPKCYKDLNKEECICEKEEKENKFSVLKDMFKEV